MRNSSIACSWHLTSGRLSGLSWRHLWLPPQLFGWPGFHPNSTLMCTPENNYHSYIIVCMMCLLFSIFQVIRRYCNIPLNGYGANIRLAHLNPSAPCLGQEFLVLLLTTIYLLQTLRNRKEDYIYILTQNLKYKYLVLRCFTSRLILSTRSSNCYFISKKNMKLM